MKEKVSYWLAVLFLMTVLVGAFAAYSSGAESADPIQILNDDIQQAPNRTFTVEIVRGGEGALTETVENGVSVVRGQSNYPVYQTRENENAPAVSQAGQDMDAWFRAYDAWRAKWIYRKLHPQP